MHAQEALDTLAAFGAYDGSPEKQLWRANHANQTCELLHPSTKDDAGNPAVVTVSLNDVDRYVAKGFTVPPRPVVVTATDEDGNVVEAPDMNSKAQKDAFVAAGGTLPEPPRGRGKSR